MHFYSRIPITVLLLFCTLLSACGVQVKSSLPKDASLPTSIAVLPADYSVEIPRERVDYVRSALISELRNNKFVVVDDKILTSMCSSPTCPEMKSVADKYLIEGFISLKLSSFTKNNFLAGYYNALSGELSFANKTGKELVNIKHTESEKGGLLFESGQVFQGIISQVKNSGDSAFDNLANKFARTLVQQLPESSKSSSNPPQPEGTEIAINAFEAMLLSPSTYKLCADGTPASFGYVYFGKDRSSLREVSPGQYCGAFSTLVAFKTSGNVQVELRSAYGDAARRDVNLPIIPPCSLEKRLELASNGQKHEMIVKCAKIGKAGGVGVANCSDSLKECSAEKLLVFGAESPAGPFEKINEVKSAYSTLSKVPKSIQVVAVGMGGTTSLPTQLSSTTK